MKTFKLILPALALSLFVACSTTTRHSEKVAATADADNQADTTLVATMAIPAASTANSPIEMTFTVYNRTDSIKTFCKWHTPFEPLMSKYLDITSANGEEASYKGPMAKRIMPPPADSYVSIKPKDSLSIKVDLTKAYDIKPGSYVVSYNSQAISGLSITDSVKISVK
ncbi:protease [Pedobacter frigiditerrae]|uniref:protease n=1 Tax=Pedobacter frigiditerrae TaxID=2530452 RepID=UPI002930703E|nr:protease [Pedobacter frigiditerrae]